MAQLDCVIKVIWGIGTALFFLFGILSVFFSAKYAALIQNRYPQKAREYGCPPDGWSNSGRLLLSLWMNELQDPDIHMYRVRARRYFVAVVVSLISMGIGTLVVFLVGAYFGAD